MVGRQVPGLVAAGEPAHAIADHQRPPQGPRHQPPRAAGLPTHPLRPAPPPSQPAAVSDLNESGWQDPHNVPAAPPGPS
jgi:hypothetical protein